MNFHSYQRPGSVDDGQSSLGSSSSGEQHAAPLLQPQHKLVAVPVSSSAARGLDFQVRERDISSTMPSTPEADSLMLVTLG